MAVQAKTAGVHPSSRWLILAVCAGQVGLIALPFLFYSKVVPLLVVMVLLSVAALFGSVTLAVLYLCLVSAVAPTQFYDDHLLLPLDFKFYEGLFMVVWAVAGVTWLHARQLTWRRTRLDRPVLVFLVLVAASMGLGQYYGQDVWQMLRDVRYPFYYALFFVVTGFFDHRRSRTFLAVVVVSAAVVGVEYLVEFLEVVSFSYSGAFRRVARTEGLMLTIGALVVAAGFVYDSSLFRRVLGGLALIPIGLGLVLTMGRAMWVGLIMGLFCLGGLVVLDRRARQKRTGRILLLVLLPLLLVGMGYVFERVTRAGVGDMAVRRLQGAVNYEGGDQSIYPRLMAYKLALQKIQKRPLLGGGHGTTVSFQTTDDTMSYTYMFISGQVDSLYLTLMMRMGIVGLAFFLWIFIRALRIAYRLFQRTADPRTRYFCATFFVVYIAMLVYGMADTTMVGNRLIFFHATFLGILARLDGEEQGESRGQGSGGRGP